MHPLPSTAPGTQQMSATDDGLPQNGGLSLRGDQIAPLHNHPGIPQSKCSGRIPDHPLEWPERHLHVVFRGVPNAERRGGWQE